MKDKCEIENVIQKSCISFIICLLENFHGYSLDVHENWSQITYDNNNNNNNQVIMIIIIIIYIFFFFFFIFCYLYFFINSFLWGLLLWQVSFSQHTRFLCNFFQFYPLFKLWYWHLPFYSFYNITLNFN